MLVCVRVFCLPVICVLHVCAWCPIRPGEGVESAGTEDTVVSHRVGVGIESEPSARAVMLLATEPSLQKKKLYVNSSVSLK